MTPGAFLARAARLASLFAAVASLVTFTSPARALYEARAEGSPEKDASVSSVFFSPLGLLFAGPALGFGAPIGRHFEVDASGTVGLSPESTLAGSTKTYFSTDVGINWHFSSIFFLNAHVAYASPFAGEGANLKFGDASIPGFSVGVGIGERQFIGKSIYLSFVAGVRVRAYCESCASDANRFWIPVGMSHLGFVL
jgi:hypothetical protein